MKHILLKILSCALVFVLITAMALSLSSCGNKPETDSSEPSGEQQANLQTFTFEVTFADGSTKTQAYETAAENLGEYLQQQGVIAGDDSEYGLYVKTVMGETLDYDTDGQWWAFYVNGELATSGVDSTQIEDGATYAFKAEKA